MIRRYLQEVILVDYH